MRSLSEMIKESRRIVFFGGAGVSTESGIPDFRGENGLYRQKFAYSPEVMLSRSFFDRHTEEFFNFYREKMVPKNILPSRAHKALTAFEQAGKLSCIITQNIDGLHQDAGSQRVLELHGSVRRNYCMKCGKFYPLSAVSECAGIPRCFCGGIIKPDVVLYEENLNQDVLEEAVNEIRQSDLLIVGGTSLTVYPAAGLIRYRGGRLVLINKSATQADEEADLCLHESVGTALEEALLSLSPQY